MTRGMLNDGLPYSARIFAKVDGISVNYSVEESETGVRYEVNASGGESLTLEERSGEKDSVVRIIEGEIGIAERLEDSTDYELRSQGQYLEPDNEVTHLLG